MVLLNTHKVSTAALLAASSTPPHLGSLRNIHTAISLIGIHGVVAVTFVRVNVW